MEENLQILAKLFGKNPNRFKDAANFYACIAIYTGNDTIEHPSTLEYITHNAFPILIIHVW